MIKAWISSPGTWKILFCRLKESKSGWTLFGSVAHSIEASSTICLPFHMQHRQNKCRWCVIQRTYKYLIRQVHLKFFWVLYYRIRFQCQPIKTVHFWIPDLTKIVHQELNQRVQQKTCKDRGRGVPTQPPLLFPSQRNCCKSRLQQPPAAPAAWSHRLLAQTRAYLHWHSAHI